LKFAAPVRGKKGGGGDPRRKEKNYCRGVSGEKEAAREGGKRGKKGRRRQSDYVHGNRGGEGLNIFVLPGGSLIFFAPLTVPIKKKEEEGIAFPVCAASVG